MSSLSDKSSSLRNQLEESKRLATQGEGTFDGLAPSDSGTARGSDSKRKSSSLLGAAALLPSDDKTVISKHLPQSDAPPIPVGPLDSRTSLEGMTLDHFRLESFVGGGGMGAVFRGFDLRLNRPVAIKILSRDQSDQETIKRFQNEAQNTARLDHPHIARVYYIGEDKGWNFIVFEFIEGENLRDRIESRGQLSLEEALGFTLQIAEALDHAQARDVVHRDIKPSNVLVTPEGTIKLVDMGLARLHQVNAPADDLTASGVTLGTFDYISPEQAKNPRTADVRSDIYSLGCTLYFMLAGRPPFPEGTALQKLLWHTGEEPPDIRLFRPDVPDAMCALLAKMMAKRPEQRFQSAQELIDYIVDLSQLPSLSADRSSTSSRFSHWNAHSNRGSDWQTYMPLGVAAVLLLIMALWPEPRVDRALNPVLALPKELDSRLPVTAMPVLQPVNEAPDENPSTTKGLLDTKSAPLAEPARSSPPGKSLATADIAPPNKSNSPAESTPPPSITPPSETASLVPPVSANSSNVNLTNIVQVQLPGELNSNGSTLANSKVFASLREAVRYAALHSEIDTIELAFDGAHVVRERLSLPAQSLKIRAASNHRPLLQFRLSEANSQPCLSLPMPGSSLIWENIFLEFPLADFRADAVLFQIPAQATVELHHCAVTVVAPSMATSAASHVTLFDCLAPVNAEAVATLDDATETPPTRILLKNSVIRGDCTVCRLAEDYPLRLSISNSFLATKFHLLETGGLLLKPRWMDRIRATIQQSTLVCDEGVIFAGSHSTLPQRMEIRLQMSANLVVTQRDRPLIEYRGGETGDEARLSFDGDGNFYPRTFTFLRRVVQQDGQESSYDTSMGDLPRWAEDRNSEQGQLANALLDVHYEEVLPAEVALKSPGEARVGCLLELLPSVEAPKRRAVMGATNMETSKGDMPSTLAPPMMDEKSNPRPESLK